MSNLKVAVRLASLGQPFKKALHTAARLGAEAVEIDARTELRPEDMTRTAVRHVRKLLDDLNLRVAAVSFYTRYGYNVLEQLDQRVEATKRVMQMAYDLGTNVVVNYVGRVPEVAEGTEWELLVQVLADLGRHGQRAGAILAAQTGAEDPEDLDRLIGALPEGSIAVDLDPGALIINGFSARKAAQLLGPHVVHVHAHDGVRDVAQRRGLEVPLGRGSADFPQLLGILEEHHYRGYLTVARQQSDRPIEEIGLAVQYLHNLVG